MGGFSFAGGYNEARSTTLGVSGIARSRLKWCVFVDSYIGYTVLSTSMDFGMRDRVDV